jgi:ubiquinone/menaquinone biosynthesis C-methylase UbiE
MLHILIEKVKKLKVTNVEPMLSKPNEIPLEDDCVDLLISINTLHEFGDREEMIKEMRRAVKRNGQLLIVDFKKEAGSFGPPVSIRIMKDRAVKLFEKHGFRVSKFKDLAYHYLLVFVND